MNRYENIGKAIKNRREKKGIKAKEADLALAEEFGLSLSTAKNEREHIEYGFIYGSPSPMRREKRGKIYMDRLSFFLGFLDFDQADYNIVKIKRIDKRFNYPLPDSPEPVFRVHKVKK